MGSNPAWCTIFQPGPVSDSLRPPRSPPCAGFLVSGSSLCRRRGQRDVGPTERSYIIGNGIRLTRQIPRLGRFNQRHPHIEVRVEATSAVMDLRRDRIDVALRHGLGVYPNLHVTQLIAPVLVPVTRPAFMAAIPPLMEPQDCLNFALLHDSDRTDWALWLAAHGVAKDLRAERGTAFEDDFLLIRAAEAGQGLALVAQEYAREEIAAGCLVQVLDKPWPARFAYYVVTRPDAMQRDEVKAFVERVMEQAQGSI